MEDNQLGRMIKHRRLYIDKSLRALANETGISFSHLSKIERGEHTPSKEMLKILAEHLEVSEYDLLVLAGYQVDAEKKMWENILIKLVNKKKLTEIKSILEIDDDSKFDLDIASIRLRNHYFHDYNLKPELRGLITEYFVKETSRYASEVSYGFYDATTTNIVSEVKEELGSDYVKWLELADKLSELGYTPDSVKEVVINHEIVMDKIRNIAEDFNYLPPLRMSAEEIEDRLRNFKYKED